MTYNSSAYSEMPVSNSSGSSSSLISRNITVLKRRTSVRLEPEMWVALRDIARRESCSVHDLCSLIYVRKSDNTSLTAAIRVFLMLYFRAATTEQGHAEAGHGDFNAMRKRARLSFDFSDMTSANTDQDNRNLTFPKSQHVSS